MADITLHQNRDTTTFIANTPKGQLWMLENMAMKHMKDGGSVWSVTCDIPNDCVNELVSDMRAEGLEL